MLHPVNDLFALLEQSQSVWKPAIETYIKEGGDINHPCVFVVSPHFGQTLLIRAVQLNSIPLIKWLLEHKANPNIPHQKTQQTPLSYLLSNPNLDSSGPTISKALLDYGCDVNKVDECTYMSPLYHILSLPTQYNSHHALIARQLLHKDAVSAFKSHPDFIIGEPVSSETPHTVILHQNPAFVFLSNETQPLTNDYYALLQFLIKKTREKSYVQLYNFFPNDKSARTLDKYADCTFFQHLVVCNGRIYPFTPLTFLFSRYRRSRPDFELVSHVMENSDATLHPDLKFLSHIEKLYKEYIQDNRILTQSRPNALGGTMASALAAGNASNLSNTSSKDRVSVSTGSQGSQNGSTSQNSGEDINSPLGGGFGNLNCATVGNDVIVGALHAPQIIPDPRLIYQTYCNLGFTVLSDILVHPSVYDDNALALVRAVFACDSFRQHYKNWSFYSDPYVKGYFPSKAIQHYKKTKITIDRYPQFLLYDPQYEEKYSHRNRIVQYGGQVPEYITEVDSDSELFVTELQSDPFFIDIDIMCRYFTPHDVQRHFANNLAIQHLTLHSTYATLFFPNGLHNPAFHVHNNTSVAQNVFSQPSLGGSGGGANGVGTAANSHHDDNSITLSHSDSQSDLHRDPKSATLAATASVNAALNAANASSSNQTSPATDPLNVYQSQLLSSTTTLLSSDVNASTFFRPFDEYFNTLYDLMLSHTISLHLSKEQLDVGRELMSFHLQEEEEQRKKDKPKKSNGLFHHNDTKHSTDNHNYMYRASGALLLAIKGRSRPNVDFIEYLIRQHYATTTISMYSFHNVFLWLLSSCQDLELDHFRYLLTLLLDEAGCDVLSVKYQQRIHQITSASGAASGASTTQAPRLTATHTSSELSHDEHSRMGSVTHMSSEASRYDPQSVGQSSLTKGGASSNGLNSNVSNINPGIEDSVSKRGSRSLFSRFTSIFQSGPNVITKTLARQYGFDYFSLVLLYCLTSPNMNTYAYIYAMITMLQERLHAHISQTSMSVVVARETFTIFNRDHLHSHVIEYHPLFVNEQNLLTDKKHVANSILLYFLVYGNLRLAGAADIYHFFIQRHSFKHSSYYVLFQCFLTLHQEKYWFEQRQNQHYHDPSLPLLFMQDMDNIKIQRLGKHHAVIPPSSFFDPAVSMTTAGTTAGNGGNHSVFHSTNGHSRTRQQPEDDSSDSEGQEDRAQDPDEEEDRLILQLKITPKLLLTPRSPLLTEPGFLFFEHVIQEYWVQEVKRLRSTYHYDESACNDNLNNKNAIYNQQFNWVLTQIATVLVNNVIYSPSDGVWLAKCIEKFLDVAKNDILSQRAELDRKWLYQSSQYDPQDPTHAALIAANGGVLPNNASNSIADIASRIVNLESSRHTTDLTYFSNANKGIDYAAKIDCTCLFFTPIHVTAEVYNALKLLTDHSLHFVFICYQQFYNTVSLNPSAYFITHTVLDYQPGLPMTAPDGTLRPALPPPSSVTAKQTPFNSSTVAAYTSSGEPILQHLLLIDDQESATAHEQQSADHDLIDNNSNNEQLDRVIRDYLIGTVRQRPPCATHHDPSSSVHALVNATHVSTIESIRRAEESVNMLRKKKIESFMRYHGPLPAMYGLLLGCSQHNITQPWLDLFDLLASQCRDLYLISKLTRTSPLSLFLYSCLVFDANALAVAKWLVQPPVQRPPGNDAVIAPIQYNAPSVSTFLTTQLTPPKELVSITSVEYQQREIDSFQQGGAFHFDFVEALYALVTAPARRHNQTYKSLLQHLLAFVHSNDLNLFSFDPNTALTQQQLQQQQFTYQAMYNAFNMNKSIVSQYLSHLSSPTQISIDLLHLLLRSGGKVHLANPTTNQSPLIYFVQQQTHHRALTNEFVTIFQLLFSNYGHCGIIFLSHERMTLFELLLQHCSVLDDICVNYMIFLLSTCHVAYHHALAYPDVMEELALLERNKNKRLLAPVIAVDRVDGLWSKTHKIIDTCWVEHTESSAAATSPTTSSSTTLTNTVSNTSDSGKPRLLISPKISREEFSVMFDFYHSMTYFPSNARYFSVVHALANHRDQHIVATIFGNVPDHEHYLYYNDQTRNVTLKEVIIEALTQRRKELNNYLHFSINLETIDCIENVEEIQTDDHQQQQQQKGGNNGYGKLFQSQFESATPNTAPAIPEWATALSEKMHLNFARKRQQRTIRDGTEGLLWYILNNVPNPRPEDILTMLEGLKDDEGRVISTAISLDYVNSNNETTLQHAIARRWHEDILVYMIERIGLETVRKQCDNNGRTALDYMTACCTLQYAPKAVELLVPNIKKLLLKKT